MREVQLREARATLSALVEGAARGETSIIMGHGKRRAIILGSMSGIASAMCRPLAGCYCPRFGRRRPAATRHKPVTGCCTLGTLIVLSDTTVLSAG